MADEDDWGGGGGGEDAGGGGEDDWGDSGGAKKAAKDEPADDWDEPKPKEGKGKDAGKDGGSGGKQKSAEHDEPEQSDDPLDVRVSNEYFLGEDCKREDPAQAITHFRNCCKLGEPKLKELPNECQGHVFKAATHLTVLLLDKKEYVEFIAWFKKLFTLMAFVTNNEGQEAINTILDASTKAEDVKTAEQVYQIACEALEKSATPGSFSRRLFDVRMKLVKVLIGRGATEEASTTLDVVHKSLQLPNGQDDRKQYRSELLDVYVMKFQITGDRKILTANDFFGDQSGTVNDPRSQSILKEIWGTVFGDEGQWLKAKGEFYTAFSMYDELGNPYKAKQCLKYTVIANMLSGSEANVLDAQNAKAYENDKDIKLVNQLRLAHLKCDVQSFNKVLWELKKDGDAFLLKHIDTIASDFQHRAIVMLVKPYRRVKLQHLANVLNDELSKVEEIVVHLILDGLIDARIDQVKGVLDLSGSSGGSGKKYSALDVWCNALQGLVANLKQPSTGGM